jgi:hypothetical protein
LDYLPLFTIIHRFGNEYIYVGDLNNTQLIYNVNSGLLEILSENDYIKILSNEERQNSGYSIILPFIPLNTVLQYSISTDDEKRFKKTSEDDNLTALNITDLEETDIITVNGKRYIVSHIFVTPSGDRMIRVSDIRNNTYWLDTLTEDKAFITKRGNKDRTTEAYYGVYHHFDINPNLPISKHIFG